MTVKHGLSESEMEDLIACDDDVLNEVYQDWTPNVRRPPTLLLIRLLHELSDYMGKKLFFILHEIKILSVECHYVEVKGTNIRVFKLCRIN